MSQTLAKLHLQKLIGSPSVPVAPITPYWQPVGPYWQPVGPCRQPVGTPYDARRFPSATRRSPSVFRAAGGRCLALHSFE